MTEDDLLGAVLDMARLFGVLAAHFRPALSQSGRWHTAVQGDGKGYPDLTLVGTGVLFRELKSETGAASPEQRMWAAMLTEAGADVAMWRPRDLRSGRIETELRSIAVRKASVETRKPIAESARKATATPVRRSPRKATTTADAWRALADKQRRRA